MPRAHGPRTGPRTDAATLAAAVERDAALSAERLAARLRESLDRFAAQARALPPAAGDRLVPALDDTLTTLSAQSFALASMAAVDLAGAGPWRRWDPRSPGPDTRCSAGSAGGLRPAC
ncbi:hypothetical protein ABT167_17930 [Streptomyces sp. NPDC001792]|uniref:hypothetical protein n=1 Tax=Streptomyces sp. NPDC001792 TaxID=3154524 RepID=UPI003326A26D